MTERRMGDRRRAGCIALAALVSLLAVGGCRGNAVPEGQAAGGAPDGGLDGMPATAPDGVSPGTHPAGDAGSPGDAGGPGDDVAEPPAGGDWTIGRAARDHGDGYVATLREVRTARHDGFDRIVLDFGGDVLPSWEVEYVDRPVRQCGSGDAVDVAGDGWLSIHVRPARAHTDRGEATVTDRRRSLRLGVLRELVVTCDFEAHVVWVAGVASPNRFRAFELSAPARLVVDIAHGP
jgi:hypothetical protein